MILDLRPNRTVEVGSGYSTRIARKAVQYGGLETRIAVIDPQPRTEVQTVADEIVNALMEDVDASRLSLQAGDILFVDSSHICRARGDVPRLYCQIIPKLPSGVTVHVHDVFLPYDYPTNWDHLCWQEQYVLHWPVTVGPLPHIACYPLCESLSSKRDAADVWAHGGTKCHKPGALRSVVLV